MGDSKRFRWLGMAAVVVVVGLVLLRLQQEPAVPSVAQSSSAESPASVRSSEALEEATLAKVNEPGVEPRRSMLVPRLGAEGQTPAREAAAPRAPERSLRGRVLLPSGVPAEDALVTLIQMSGGAPVGDGRNERCRTDGLGQFTLDVPSWAWNRTVHLSARRSGTRPYSGVIRIDPAELASPRELMLEEGREISGRLVRSGQPLGGVYVGLDVAYGVPGHYGAGPESWWAGGRMEEKHGETETDENGYFSVQGLSAARHRVYFQETGAPPGQITAHLFAVTAPDSRVYDLTPATLGLSVLSQAGPLEGAEISVSVGHSGTKVMSELDPVEVQVLPGQTVRVVARHHSAEEVAREVVAPPAGQWLDVALAMHLLERPRLIVEVPGAETDRLSFSLCKPTGADPVIVEAQRLTSDGAFVVEAVPRGPGTYNLSIEPGDAGSWRGFLYPVVCQLELPASGDVHATLPLTWGGRCEVEMLSKSGFASLAHYQLVDTAGTVCLTRWIAPGLGVDSPIEDFEGDYEVDYDEMFEEEIETSSTSTDASEQGVELDPARHVEQRANAHGLLLPGVYTLKVTADGFEAWVREVEVTAGNVTIVEAWLDEAE